MLLALAVACLVKGQSHLEYSVQASGEEIIYYTTNARIKGLATTFVLCFEASCKSTLARDQFPDVTEEAVVETLTTPEGKFAALFVMSNANILSIWDFEKATVCMGTIFTDHVPYHCRFGPVAVGVCSGAGLECRFRARVDNNKPAVGIFTDALTVPCGEVFELETDKGYQRLCGEKVADATYVFSTGLAERTASVSTVPGSNELFLFIDLRVHDELEVGLFSLVIVLSIVVWVRATNGGQPISDEKLFIVPTSFQRILIADVSFSVGSTGIFQIIKHREGLVPAPCSHQFGDHYAWLATVLFVMLNMGCNAIAANCVRRPLTTTSIARAILLRHALEIQLMLSLFFYFPASFGWELRELMGIFVGSVVLAVLGRDAKRIVQICKAPMLWLMAPLFLLEFHQCTLVCIFPALYRTPGILNDAAATSAVAMGSAITFMGTML